MKDIQKTSVAAQGNLIEFDSQARNPVSRMAVKLAARAVERPLGLREVNACYADLLGVQVHGSPFESILRLLDITYIVTSSDLAKIPEQGPLVVVANHPFGGIEGIILGELFQRIRPDIKLLGNYLLTRIAPIRDAIIPVDPFDRRSSVASNAAAFRTCLRWLKAGNCLVTFPAGEVSHYRYRYRRVTDPPWRSHIAALIRMSGARVLPVFFPGRNSVLFNLMGMVHPRLRTLMLARELLARKASRVSLFMGQPIGAERIEAFDNDRALIRWLRFKTYFLANRMDVDSPSGPPREYRSRKIEPEPATIAPVSRELLAAEIAALDSRSRLVTHKNMTVLVADSEQIPHLLREIGRLREITFREVGEGTGKSMHVDLFDSYYLRLNGQFIAFNVDRDFRDAIDGLVVVDLMKTETRLLDRFMGKEGRRLYHEYWSEEKCGCRLR